jgi:predicted unusual protein kinase regulating ubiquinone biosynthesis (AarF/ABC1/UbiB family)
MVIPIEYRAKYLGADEEELRQFMRKEIKDSREQMAEKATAVTGVMMKVEDLQRENSDAFQIPEWFLYTSRTFLTLEGISLQADSDFSIVKSCFPYIAKRLLGDDSPRSQKALRDLIYGKEDDLNTDK